MYPDSSTLQAQQHSWAPYIRHPSHYVRSAEDPEKPRVVRPVSTRDAVRLHCTHTTWGPADDKAQKGRESPSSICEHHRSSQGSCPSSETCRARSRIAVWSLQAGCTRHIPSTYRPAWLGQAPAPTNTGTHCFSKGTRSSPTPNSRGQAVPSPGCPPTRSPRPLRSSGAEQVLAPVPQSTHRVVVSNIFDLFVVICSGQLSQPLGVELAAVREQLRPVLLGQLSAKRVDGDNEGPPVSFKLREKRLSPRAAGALLEVGRYRCCSEQSRIRGQHEQAQLSAWDAHSSPVLSRAGYTWGPPAGPRADAWGLVRRGNPHLRHKPRH